MFLRRNVRARSCRRRNRRKETSVAPHNPNPLPDDAVEAAITRVLAAEATSRDAVARARVEAAEIAERTRGKARRLVAHTDLRIRAVRAAFNAHVAAEVAALEAQAAALGAAPVLTPAEAASVDKAAAALAHAMTGGST
jgi:hypothetical protein